MDLQVQRAHGTWKGLKEENACMHVECLYLEREEDGHKVWEYKEDNLWKIAEKSDTFWEEANIKSCVAL